MEQLIKKTCHRTGCFKTFRAMPSNKFQYCSSQCAADDGVGGHKWGAQKKVFSKGESQPASECESDLKTQPSAKPSTPENVNIISVTEKKKMPESTGTISPTRSDAMESESVGLQKTVRSSEPLSVPSIIESAPNSLQKSTQAETSETLPVLSEESRGSLQREGLNSMRLLQKSGNKLLSVMDECVSESDMQKAKDGTQRVESHRIQQTIEAANALAHTVQVQANLVKSMVGLFKGG